MNLLSTVHGVNNIKSTIYTVVFCCSVLTQVNIHVHSNLHWEMILTDTKQWLFLHCKLSLLHLPLNLKICTIPNNYSRNIIANCYWRCENIDSSMVFYNCVNWSCFYRCSKHEETSCYVHVNRVLLFVRLLVLCVSIGMHQSAVIYVSRAMQIQSVWRSTYKPCTANCGHTSVR